MGPRQSNARRRRDQAIAINELLTGDPHVPAPNHRDQTVRSVSCAIITVSDTRTEQTDVGGKLIHELLTQKGHTIHSYQIVSDDPLLISEVLVDLRDADQCQAVLLTGGTGLSPRDTTYEAVSALLDKRLDGFGELFRQKSFDQIGPAAMLSRAVAGVMGRAVVFSMPGSPAAVRLAMDELILPKLGHIAFLLKRTQ